MNGLASVSDDGDGEGETAVLRLVKSRLMGRKSPVPALGSSGMSNRLSAGGVRW